MTTPPSLPSCRAQTPPTAALVARPRARCRRASRRTVRTRRPRGPGFVPRVRRRCATIRRPTRRSRPCARRMGAAGRRRCAVRRIARSGRRRRAAAAQSLSELKDAASGAVLCRWAERPRAVRAPCRAARIARVARPRRVRARAARSMPNTPRCAPKRGGARLARSACVATACRHRDTRCCSGRATHCGRRDRVRDTRRRARHPRSVRQLRPRMAGARGSGHDARQLRIATAREPLVAALDDDYWQVRLRAARALATARRPRRRPSSRCSHAISNLRKEAALALGELRDRATLPALTHALEDHDPEVRRANRDPTDRRGVAMISPTEIVLDHPARTLTPAGRTVTRSASRTVARRLPVCRMPEDPARRRSCRCAARSDAGQP